MTNIDLKEAEERIATTLVDKLSTLLATAIEKDLNWNELVRYCMEDVSVTRKGMPIGDIVGTSVGIIITDEAEEQPKKQVPFYQTLNKQPKFVRK